MDVKRYYEKAMLRLPEDETQREIQIAKFERIVAIAEDMMKVDTSEFEIFEITSQLDSPLREDEVVESIDRELAFSNTVHREYGYFKLENILENK